MDHGYKQNSTFANAYVNGVIVAKSTETAVPNALQKQGEFNFSRTGTGEAPLPYVKDEETNAIVFVEPTPAPAM